MGGSRLEISQCFSETALYVMNCGKHIFGPEASECPPCPFVMQALRLLARLQHAQAASMCRPAWNQQDLCQRRGSKTQQFSMTVRINGHQATTMRLNPDVAHGHVCVRALAAARWHQCTECRRPGWRQWQKLLPYPSNLCKWGRDCAHQHLWVSRGGGHGIEN